MKVLRTSHAKVTDAGRLLDRLRRHLRSNVQRLPDRPGSGLVSVTLPAAGLLLGPHLPADREGYFWSRASSGSLACGTGIAARIACRGGNRFAVLEEAFKELRAGWLREPGLGVPPPIAFLGFAFSPDEEPGPEWSGLENTELVVPEIVYRRDGEAEWLTFSASVGSGGALPDLASRWSDGLESLVAADREGHATTGETVTIDRVGDDGWSAPIERALEDIHAGHIDKVVLTRRVRYEASRPLTPGRVLKGLVSDHDGCARFAVTRSGFALLGVSPERLLSLRDGTVVADALAGTAPRGATTEEDLAIADRLGHDPKALEEHRIVVNQIRSALDPSCSGLVVPQSPEVMSLPTVHHLWSPVHGHLKNGSGLLELSSRLHPTPAVGGSPRNEALSWLARHERQGRGWYTGAYGWMDTDGNGELSVVLRCGIVNETSIELFAGAGIVAESDPVQEMDETEWKLRTMRGALDLG
jgi:menaquinone-specific isochorismate synthase